MLLEKLSLLVLAVTDLTVMDISNVRWQFPMMKQIAQNVHQIDSTDALATKKGTTLVNGMELEKDRQRVMMIMVWK